MREGVRGVDGVRKRGKSGVGNDGKELDVAV